MSESFTLDTSCSPRPILVTGSGHVSYAPPAPPADADQAEPPATGRRARAKVLTPPARQQPDTGGKPAAK